MSDSQVRLGDSGALYLAGVIDYRNGPTLRRAGQSLIAQSEGPLVIDCAAVEKSSSVGVALLLAFMRDATARKRSVSISSLPEDMRHIAEVSGLLELLPVTA